jgi:phosphate transport system substrate-binding protein
MALAAGLPGCGGGEPLEMVTVDGSSTVFRISRAAQIDFRKVEPDIRVAVGNHGTGGGFDRYFQGELDIIDASRDAKPEELAKAEQQDLDWTRFLVAYDGITVVVNPQNDFVKSLSVEQLKKLFAPESQVNSWKDLDPSWPDRPITLYAPDVDSGTFEFFSDAIVAKGTKTHRSDVQPSPDDNTLVTGVAGDADALGYFGYAYYTANSSRLRAVPIQDGDNAPVMPSTETILSGTYRPLSRPLYIFVKNVSLKRPSVAKFVKHYLDHTDALATSAGYVPPTESDQAANAEALAKVTGAGGAT